MTTTTERMLPLYEGKMLDQFDHRDADVVKSATAVKRQNQPQYLSTGDHKDPHRIAMPLNWVAEEELPELSVTWLAGFSDVTSSLNERTVLSAALPLTAVNHKYPLFFGSHRQTLIAMLNSFVLDYAARQKVAGQNLTYTYLRQLPVLPPSTFELETRWARPISVRQWIEIRSRELMYTAWDMVSFAVESGDSCPPFIWDPARREIIRAELDAAFFHLYGIPRDDVDYIMETFPIVKRKDEAAHGEYRTNA